jgi:prepilin-type N-terminal cleavage/methylation domain-containing protein
MKKTKRGFTLIELLIVIGIIGILATVVTVSLLEARAKGRDAERRADLNSIALALESHYSSNGTYVVSGTGSGGGGNGWFSYTGYGYPSVAQGLVTLGHFPTPLIDPSGNTSSYSDTGSAYMIQSTTSGFTLWTSLESPTAEDTATLSTCALSAWDGYSSTFPVDNRMNYCVSSH